MKHGLAIFLGGSFLNLEDSQHVVIEFPTREAAIEFAATAIRKHDPEFGTKVGGEPLADAELVTDYGDCCGASEYFHIYPIVAPDFITLE